MWPAASCSIPPSRLYFPHGLQQHRHRWGSAGNEGCDQGRTARLWCYTIIMVRSKSSLLRACWMRCQPGLDFSGSSPGGTARPRLSKAAAAGTASPQPKLCGRRITEVLFPWRMEGRTREVGKGGRFGPWRSNPAPGVGDAPGLPHGLPKAHSSSPPASLFSPPPKTRLMTVLSLGTQGGGAGGSA